MQRYGGPSAVNITPKTKPKVHLDLGSTKVRTKSSPSWYTDPLRLSIYLPEPPRQQFQSLTPKLDDIRSFLADSIHG